jgi:type VI secretion system protein ImpM
MEVGLYGKLPTHGDFLRRRVAEDFVERWDAWLQECLAESRASLGEGWLDTYLTSPIWRFALPAAVCGSAAVAGILVPSVDRVGRYFPLTIVWPTPADLSTLEIAVRFQAGFEHAERLLLDTLAADHFEFADFDRGVMNLAAHFEHAPSDGSLRLTAASASALSSALLQPRCVPLRDASDLVAPCMQIYGRLLDSAGGLAFWWTDGSAAVAPSWLMTRGLPLASQYSAMLDGAWNAAGWELGATEGDAEQQEEQDFSETIVRPEEAQALVVVSGAHSDRGSTRETNQDAFIDRPDLRLWAVADGMGGLKQGDVASRMVCDALANTPIAADLDEQIDAVIDQLRQVNDYLRRSAKREVDPIQSGTTVVALLIRGKDCAVVWGGDSRAYRLRDGVLTQLTEDHSWSAEEEGASDTQAITCAVGAEDTFSPDTYHGEVRAGDRFLLCSDGVYRVLESAELTQILPTRDPSAASKHLVSQAMAKGSTDNVTALVVDCGGIHPPALTDALQIVSL